MPRRHRQPRRDDLRPGRTDRAWRQLHEGRRVPSLVALHREQVRSLLPHRHRDLRHQGVHVERPETLRRSERGRLLPVVKFLPAARPMRDAAITFPRLGRPGEGRENLPWLRGTRRRSNASERHRRESKVLASAHAVCRHRQEHREDCISATPRMLRRRPAPPSNDDGSKVTPATRLLIGIGSRGLSGLPDKADNAHTFEVDQVLVHPDYDAALLHLTAPSGVRPISIATDLADGERATMLGWGTRSARARILAKKNGRHRSSIILTSYEAPRRRSSVWRRAGTPRGLLSGLDEQRLRRCAEKRRLLRRQRRTARRLAWWSPAPCGSDQLGSGLQEHLPRRIRSSWRAADPQLAEPLHPPVNSVAPRRMGPRGGSVDWASGKETPRPVEGGSDEPADVFHRRPLAGPAQGCRQSSAGPWDAGGSRRSRSRSSTRPP